MIGCIALTALFGLAAFKLIRHRHACAAGYGRWGGGPPWARGHHHHHHRHGGFGRGGGRHSYLWHALESLDLTPAQEKVVKTEVAELKDKARGLKDEGKTARADMAASIRGESFEEGSLAAMFIRHDDLLHGLRGDLAGALGRIHAVLDPAQRERLAEMIESSGPRRPWGGPYR
ncbi:MAG TPA: hypothetical protein VIG06_12945 [Kofleriaceae bacterium]|jgi:uncharacterized membrane protein